MTTTTVLSDDTATIVRDDTARFSWGSVLAGSVIAAAVTFFLISLGSGIGLALTSAHAVTLSGAKTFLTLGAIYFMVAQAFGFALGGHVTGRLMPPVAENSEEENFRADAHGLAVWALAVVFGFAIVGLGALTTAAVGANGATTPAAYWADRLLTPAPSATAELASTVQAPSATTTTEPQTTIGPSKNGPLGLVSSPARGTLADAKAEAARLLTVDSASGQNDFSNQRELARLVTVFAGLSSAQASNRVRDTEDAMRAKAKETAETARKAASYIGIWTAIALLFGAIVSIAATVSARWKDEHDMFGRSRRV